MTTLRTLLLGLNDLSALPFLPRGPYLCQLAMLGLSDCFGEDACGLTLRAVAAELEGAVGLEVLRINRNDALGLTAWLVSDAPRGKLAPRGTHGSQWMVVESCKTRLDQREEEGYFQRTCKHWMA